MLSVILFSALFVLFVLIAILIDKYGGYDWDWLGCVSGGLAVISFIIAGWLWSDLVNINKRFDSFVNKYEFTKELVGNYEPNDYGNKPALLVEVIEINNEIAKHKAFVGNTWSGAWYSPKIAELEPIVFAGKTPAISVENVTQ